MQKFTPDQLQRIYQIARNAILRYRLDQYEDEALKTILGTLRKSMREQEKVLDRWMSTQTQVERGEALLAEFDALTAGIRSRLTDDILDVSSHAGAWATAEHVSILSFGGLTSGFNNVSLTAEQFRQFFADTPLGGATLAEWVDKAFDSTAKAQLREALNVGVLQGEGIRPLVKRVLGESLGLTEREAITLTRTYVQSANVAAIQAVQNANADIIKEWEWCSVLENGNAATGAGVCPRCAALDGQRFKLNEGPPIPLHPRCRCYPVTITKTWRELGIDADDLERVARPYAEREDLPIDAGGRRDILEHGFHDGDYASWWKTRSKDFQDRVIGPRRAELVRAGTVSFHDLVDGQGRLLTLKELLR